MTTNLRIQNEMIHGELRIAATYRWMAQWPKVQYGRDDYRKHARTHLAIAREWRMRRPPLP